MLNTTRSVNNIYSRLNAIVRLDWRTRDTRSNLQNLFWIYFTEACTIQLLNAYYITTSWFLIGLSSTKKIHIKWNSYVGRPILRRSCECAVTNNLLPENITYIKRKSYTTNWFYSRHLRRDHMDEGPRSYGRDNVYYEVLPAHRWGQCHEGLLIRTYGPEIRSSSPQL